LPNASRAAETRCSRRHRSCGVPSARPYRQRRDHRDSRSASADVAGALRGGADATCKHRCGLLGRLVSDAAAVRFAGRGRGVADDWRARRRLRGDLLEPYRRRAGALARFRVARHRGDGVGGAPSGRDDDRRRADGAQPHLGRRLLHSGGHARLRARTDLDPLSHRSLRHRRDCMADGPWPRSRRCHFLASTPMGAARAGRCGRSSTGGWCAGR
jgi:hypothetical protein